MRTLLLTALLLGLAIDTQAHDVTIAAGVSQAPTLGYDAGPLVELGLRAPRYDVRAWWDGAAKAPPDSGHSFNLRVTNASGRAAWPLVGLGARRFDGPWRKDFLWGIAGVQGQTRSIAWSTNYRAAFFESAANRERILEGELASRGRVGIGLRAQLVSFYDRHPDTPLRWGWGMDATARVRLHGSGE